MAELFDEGDGAVLPRTDYSDDAAWERVRDAALSPVLLSEAPGDEYAALLQHVSDPQFEGYGDRIAKSGVEWPGQFFIVVADARSMTEDPPTLLVIDLGEDEVPGRGFRTTVAELPHIEVNLSLSNLDFADFADGDGVFRGLA